MADQLKNNPNSEFINKLSEFYKDKVIDDDEFMDLARIQIDDKKAIDVNFEERFVFDEAKVQFEKAWITYQKKKSIFK